eukprot:2444035-Prymnesium_polylepis.1
MADFRPRGRLLSQRARCWMPVEHGRSAVVARSVGRGAGSGTVSKRVAVGEGPNGVRAHSSTLAPVVQGKGVPFPINKLTG